MAHIKTSIKGENASNQSKLLYGLHDKPPLRESLFTALQHVFASFIPTVTPGLLVTGALGLDPKAAAYLLGMSLFVSGLGTFIQVFQPGFIGSGLLSVQGTSFAFVTPMLAVVADSLDQGKTPEETIALILGLCFFGSFIPIVMSRFLHLTRRVFTPLVTGIAVTLIGLCLVKAGVFYMAGGDKAQAIALQDPDSPLALGSLQNWALAMLVFGIVGVCSASHNRYLRMSSVMIGLLVGFILSIFLGVADFSQLPSLPLVNVPVPFRFGLGFDAATFISFSIIYIALTLEVVGDITATSLVSAEPIDGPVYMRRVKGGVLADGINSLLAAICGTFPVVTPAQNNGIIQLTGVGSRYVGYFIAAFLTLLGLFPAIGGVLLAIPSAVFGGAIMLMFGTVAVAGFNILREVEMDNRSFIILAVSLSMGLGVTFSPETLEHFPNAVRQILESGISTGSICAVLLNLLMPKAENPTESAEPVPTEAAPVTPDAE